MATSETEIVVIGAGVAGLMTSRILAEAGHKVLVIEARGRVGGRIFTLRPGPEAIELGAEFVHGKPPELWNLLRQAHLGTHEVDGVDFCWSKGELAPCNPLAVHEFQWIESLKYWRDDDCSFRDYLNHVSLPESTRRRLVDYVEGFNAADQSLIGVAELGKQQMAEDAIEGDRLYRVTGGYDQLPGYLAEAARRAGSEFIFNSAVVSVDWQPNSAIIEVERDGQRDQIAASQVIVTLPLGVLLAEKVEFKPKPEKILSAAARLRMGAAQRTVLTFHEPFWATGSDRPGDELRKLNFLFSTGNAPSVWWNSAPDGGACLTAWAAGPRVHSLPGDKEELEQRLLSNLAAIFKRDEAELRAMLAGSFTHDWQRDPFSLGAYSYAPVNAESAIAALTEPVKGTMYFAGEHTDTTGHWGTVHGALRSGMRAASQVLHHLSLRNRRKTPAQRAA